MWKVGIGVLIGLGMAILLLWVWGEKIAPQPQAQPQSAVQLAPGEKPEDLPPTEGPRAYRPKPELRAMSAEERKPVNHDWCAELMPADEINDLAGVALHYNKGAVLLAEEGTGRCLWQENLGDRQADNPDKQVGIAIFCKGGKATFNTAKKAAAHREGYAEGVLGADSFHYGKSAESVAVAVLLDNCYVMTSTLNMSVAQTEKIAGVFTKRLAEKKPDW